MNNDTTIVHLIRFYQDGYACDPSAWYTGGNGAYVLADVTCTACQAAHVAYMDARKAEQDRLLAGQPIRTRKPNSPPHVCGARCLAGVHVSAARASAMNEAGV